MVIERWALVTDWPGPGHGFECITIELAARVRKWTETSACHINCYGKVHCPANVQWSSVKPGPQDHGQLCLQKPDHSKHSTIAARF